MGCLTTPCVSVIVLEEGHLNTRLRYDRLMKFGWKVLLPVATANLLVTAVIVGLMFAN